MLSFDGSLTAATLVFMKSELLPMKPSLVYTEQLNLRIEKALKQDIRFLSEAGVEVSELLRPMIRDLIKQARKQIETEAS